MFGYVKPVPSELLVKEYEFYRATYCGICRAMKKHTGFLSNATLSYDSVFLAVLRMTLIPDSAFKSKHRRCIAHPVSRRPMLEENEAVVYTARAFAILTYYKMRDDVQDEGIMKRTALTPVRPILRHGAKRAKEPTLAGVIKQKLDEISAVERDNVASADEGASLFGELLGAVFSFGTDGDVKEKFYKCGYHLGRFIYCADAAEDYEKDRKKGKYNPYVLLYGAQALSAENKRMIKTGLLLECRELERVVDTIDFGTRYVLENIIKNIVYLGLSNRVAFLDSDECNDGKCDNGKCRRCKKEKDVVL